MQLIGRSKGRQVAGLAVAFALLLTGCGGGGGGSSTVTPAPVSSPAPTPTPISTEITSPEEASYFLSRATFGGTKTEMVDIEGMDAADWLADQFGKPTSRVLPDFIQRERAGEDFPFQIISREWYDRMISADDQLRQRMVFALSQIIVVEDAEQPAETAYWLDMLADNAFGNYRDLLEEVTFSTRMARYLTYFRNRKGDPETGRMPDENYAREILQLFSIGLVELNMDGTPKLTGGQEVETYDNEDIQGLARVFTGFSFAGTGFFNGFSDARRRRLQLYPEQHSELEKSFLGLTIPPNTGPDESVRRALDHIFAHPNVAPFVSRQLIQRFTTSNPSPDYVERVATAFETGRFTAPNGRVFGDNRRGSLQATLAAILLDATLFDGSRTDDIEAGKVREPILRFVHWARAFDVTELDVNNEILLLNTSDPTFRLGQHPLRSPSVFNFYRPGFVAPGTESGAAGLTAPELQLVNENTTVGYINFMTEFVANTSFRIDRDRDTYIPEYTFERSLASDPEALVDHLNTMLMGGRMYDDTRTAIIDAVSALPLDPENRADFVDVDTDRRVLLAVLMSVNAPNFIVMR